MKGGKISSTKSSTKLVRSKKKHLHHWDGVGNLRPELVNILIELLESKAAQLVVGFLEKPQQTSGGVQAGHGGIRWRVGIEMNGAWVKFSGSNRPSRKTMGGWFREC